MSILIILIKKLNKNIKLMIEIKKNKKKINSKAKGNSQELTICKILSKHLAPLCFKRSQQSGAILGGVNIKNINDYSIEMRVLFVGDVCPSNEGNGNPKFNFVIECKSYKDSERMEALFSSSFIFKWLEEAIVDAAKVNKRGLLIFKFNHTPQYCAVEADINLPNKIPKIILPNGIQVCHLEDLITHKSFWITDV
jgi:hypothetical protein